MREYIWTGIIIFFMIGGRFAYDSYIDQSFGLKKSIFYFSLIFIWPFFFIKDTIAAIKNFKLF